MKNIIYLLTIIFFITPAYCDQVDVQDTVKTMGQETIAITKSQTNEPKNSNEIQFLKFEIDKIRDRVDNITTILTWLSIFFVVVVSIGTITSILGTGISIYGFFKSESRAKEAHNLYVSGESKAQDRASEVHLKFLDGSQKTLALVNSTLELARQASEKASKALENRLRKTQQAREKDCITLLDGSGAYEDDKMLILNQDICNDIHVLGSRIAFLEHDLGGSEENLIKLGPYCCFIIGVDLYLKGQFKEALTYWEEGINDKDSPDQLKSLAFYYIGYVYNNLNDFDKAKQNFEKALSFAKGSRKFELTRISIETRFFKKEDGNELIERLINLVKEIDTNLSNNKYDKALRKRKYRTLTTLGNIYHQTENETNTQSEKNQYYELAKKTFQEVNDPQDSFYKWALFGYAEALYKLEEKEKAIELFRDKVKKEAENEFINREELRTKVLAKTTQLICSIRAKDEKDVHLCHGFVINALGDPRLSAKLTIYSQMQRRNVSKDEFRNDLDDLMKEASVDQT